MNIFVDFREHPYLMLLFYTGVRQRRKSVRKKCKILWFVGEVPRWSIWVVFRYYFWTQKYHFLKSNQISKKIDPVT